MLAVVIAFGDTIIIEDRAELRECDSWPRCNTTAPLILLLRELKIRVDAKGLKDFDTRNTTQVGWFLWSRLLELTDLRCGW